MIGARREGEGGDDLRLSQIPWALIEVLVSRDVSVFRVFTECLVKMNKCWSVDWL